MSSPLGKRMAGRRRILVPLFSAAAVIAAAFVINAYSPESTSAEAGLIPAIVASDLPTSTVPTPSPEATPDALSSTEPAEPDGSQGETPLASPSASPDKPDSPSTPTEQPSSPPEPELEMSVEEYIEVATKIASTGSDAGRAVPGPAFEDVAVDNALGALLAQADEFEANQWAQDGEAVVVEAATIEESVVDGTPTRVLAVCIDSSDVSIADVNGDAIRPADKPGSRRSLNIFELKELDGAWLVADHRFPDDADC